MSTAAPTNSAIVTDYKARTQGSGALFERARKVLPSGITHDARYLDPYSIHVAKAKGPRKWDVDGNEYVDYFGGHGAMLLGHSHPAVIDVHGGAWTRGDRATGAIHCRALAACGLVVASVDFRQGPDHQHPAASRDVAAGVRYVSGRRYAPQPAPAR